MLQRGQGDNSIPNGHNNTGEWIKQFMLVISDNPVTILGVQHKIVLGMVAWWAAQPFGDHAY